MRYRPDIVISDRSGAAVAIIQVRALADGSVQTATRYMRNLLSHVVEPHARYVLLITREAGYLWSSMEAVLHESAPTLTFPMDRITRYYLRSDDGSSPVGEIVLDAIATQWLWDLTDGITVDEQVTSSLRETGFLSVVQDGLVKVQATV
jgi:hypothetical protein